MRRRFVVSPMFKWVHNKLAVIAIWFVALITKVQSDKALLLQMDQATNDVSSEDTLVYVILIHVRIPLVQLGFVNLHDLGFYFIGDDVIVLKETEVSSISSVPKADEANIWSLTIGATLIQFEDVVSIRPKIDIKMLEFISKSNELIICLSLSLLLSLNFIC